PGLTRVRLRTGIPVVACGAVRLRRIRADATARVAYAGVVTLIRRAADDRVTARTGAALARVGLRTRVAVITGGAVCLRRIRAGAARRVTCAGVVTLIGRAPDDRVTARTGAALARVGLRTRVPVIACGAVRLCRVRAGTGGWITGASVMTLIRCTA